MSKSRQPPGNLFRQIEETNLRAAQPLAARMRPRSLDEFVGQEHFLGPGKLLRRLIAADRLGSVVFHGPPGSGKTSLAHVIAAQTRSLFRPLNAVAGGIKELRELLQSARAELEETGRRTILFVDELHHFYRTGPGGLLAGVEERRGILPGTTAHNSFSAINGPLLSRSQIFSFEPLTREHIPTLIRRALADTERGLGNIPVNMTDEALDFFSSRRRHTRCLSDWSSDVCSSD